MVITLKHLHKTYRKGLNKKIVAVKDLSFEVHQEEIFGFDYG